MENYLIYKEDLLKDLSSRFDTLNFKFVIEKIGINISVLFVHGTSKSFQESDTWEKISGEIALKYQSKIDNIVDKWNIYIIYVAVDHVSKELKNKIENNRFSSRKIVEDNFDGVLTNGKLNALIIKHISNTDLIKVIEETNIITQKKYSPVNEKLWKLIPDDESIIGDPMRQKQIIESIKKL
ncbi:hypothetical protein L1S35_06540 [Flavobacterium sp. AS60]|uniref:ABC-three component system middle component 1 n=1 Tax=Flavobacterium anseongense TaxID=2910677 RepID=UPI001F479348|nr:ABC-three component system middle component 1 [Flavobacterium sp. AS60]MCF6129324.1 hypothetical protein [Flavobacterium sp. AS60]